MNNYNIDELARQMGFNDTYLNKLKASNSYITESTNKDRDMINSQLNQTIQDYEQERQNQNNQFIKDSQAAYVDYAKSINPYSIQNNNSNRMGLGNSGYSESSLIGANNTYQNRYTTTKNNYDNIFANINNNIAKAKETGNIELAKIAKQEQERLLENLYKINDEYTAEKQREEEKRRWEAELELQKQQLAKSSSESGELIVLDDSKQKEEMELSENGKILLNGLTSYKVGETTNENLKNKARSLIYADQKSGRITEKEAEYLFSQLGL